MNPASPSQAKDLVLDAASPAAEIALWQRKMERRLHATWLLAAIGMLAAFVLGREPASVAQTIGITLTGLNTRLIAVENKTASMSVSTVSEPNGASAAVSVPTVTFTGVNVQIVNGTGSTASVNAAGNLIVGYNALRVGDDAGDDDRGGSHNIIVGDGNNYSAASFGGAVIGSYNSVSNEYASVTGGTLNSATGGASSISGGIQNIASGADSSVSGGAEGLASGLQSSVSGGYQDSATDYVSWAGGGNDNTASTVFAAACGGFGNNASGNSATITGGQNVQQSAAFGWSGGGNNGNGAYHSP